MKIAKKPYQFLLISVLRDYLGMEFEPPEQQKAQLGFPYSKERIIDDFGTPLHCLLPCAQRS